MRAEQFWDRCSCPLPEVPMMLCAAALRERETVKTMETLLACVQEAPCFIAESVITHTHKATSVTVFYTVSLLRG